MRKMYFYSIGISFFFLFFSFSLVIHFSITGVIFQLTRFSSVLMSQTTLFIKREFSTILPASRICRSHTSHLDSRRIGPQSGETIILKILNAPSAILRGILCQLAADLTIGRYSNPRNQTNYWSDYIKYFSSFVNELTPKKTHSNIISTIVRAPQTVTAVLLDTVYCHPATIMQCAETLCCAMYECSGPSRYNWFDIRTTCVRTKIFVLTYDQSVELRPAWRHTRVCGRNAGQCIALYNYFR
jgi:hypothetical protein